MGTSYAGAMTVYPLYRINQLPAAPTAAPALVSPAADTVNQPIVLTLSWGTVANATYYQVQASTSSAFTALIYSSKPLATTSQSVSGLSNSTTYYWRACAGNAGGTGAWSSLRKFTTSTAAAPDAPVLTTPTNGKTGVSVMPVLAWNAAAGATTYGIQISTVSTFATTAFSKTGIPSTACTLAVASALTISKLYYWRVNASNSSATGLWSALFSFTTASTGIAQKLPLIIAPAFSLTGSSIQYALPGQCNVRLMCYDMQGRFVASLVDATQGAGYYNLSLAKAGLARGMYLIRFSAGTYGASKLISLIY
jgi:hypothetical protein